MTAYVTSVGEKTTRICCDQLTKFGFDVVLLGEKESWLEKYKKFVNMACEKGKNCLRVDADIIPNKHIKKVGKEEELGMMIQYSLYDFYQNDVKVGAPMFYKLKALQLIRDNFNKLHPTRPEASAWRLKDMFPNCLSSNSIF